MKKLLVTAICFALLLSILSGCFGLGGSGDWDYALPNGYVISRNNAVDIHCAKQRTANTFHTVVPRYIAAFSYGDRFVGLARLPLDEDTTQKDAKLLIETYEIESFEYYLIDTEKNDVFGPFDLAGFEIACEQNDVNDLCEWIDTASIHWNSPEVQTYG